MNFPLTRCTWPFIFRELNCWPGPAVKIEPWVEAFLVEFSGKGDVSVSTRIRTPRGVLTATDLIYFGRPATLAEFKLAVCFVAATGEPSFWALATPFRRVSEGSSEWLTTPREPVVIDLSLVSAPLFAVAIGGKFVV